jgi:hypothetical protein
MDALILISPHWDIKFHVHIDAYNLAVEVLLAHNLIEKCNQPIAYASQLFNNIEQDYTMIEKEAPAMVYALHKFFHYVLGNEFIFYVDHMALLYLVRKPQVFLKITYWLFLFLEYDFLVMYKPGRSHFVSNALS